MNEFLDQPHQVQLPADLFAVSCCACLPRLFPNRAFSATEKVPIVFVSSILGHFPSSRILSNDLRICLRLCLLKMDRGLFLEDENLDFLAKHEMKSSFHEEIVLDFSSPNPSLNEISRKLSLFIFMFLFLQ